MAARKTEQHCRTLGGLFDKMWMPGGGRLLQCCLLTGLWIPECHGVCRGVCQTQSASKYDRYLFIYLIFLVNPMKYPWQCVSEHWHTFLLPEYPCLMAVALRSKRLKANQRAGLVRRRSVLNAEYVIPGEWEAVPVSSTACFYLLLSYICCIRCIVI